jgi:hypothetical protein
MQAIKEVISYLITGGMDAAEAAALVAMAIAEGTAPKGESSGAKRMRDYRNRREAMGLSRVFPADQFRRQLESRDGIRCIYCEATENLVIDHIIPSFLGGIDDLGNLGLACRPCNGKKAGRPLAETGMVIVIPSALSAHNDYNSRTCSPISETENGSPKPSTTSHNRAHVHQPEPPAISSLDSITKKENNKKNSGHALRDDWKPADDDYGYGNNLGLSRSQVDGFAEDMRLWARANANRAVGRKADWQATFHGWMRREAPKASKQHTFSEKMQSGYGDTWQ